MPGQFQYQTVFMRTKTRSRPAPNGIAKGSDSGGRGGTYGSSAVPIAMSQAPTTQTA